MGLETSAGVMDRAGIWVLSLDRAILAVFVFEIMLRIYVHRSAFFKDPWSLFDFTVVAIALIPASGPLAVLRALCCSEQLRPSVHVRHPQQQQSCAGTHLALALLPLPLGASAVPTLVYVREKRRTRTAR